MYIPPRVNIDTDAAMQRALDHGAPLEISAGSGHHV